MEYTKDILLKLLNTPSPTGDTDRALEIVRKEIESFGLDIIENAKGGFYSTIKGEKEGDERLLSAHVDTLGGMVKELKKNGRIKFDKLGSYSWTSVDGCECIISTMEGREYTGTILSTVASVHVHGAKTNEIKREMDNMEIRVDENVRSKEDLEGLGINIGDFIYFDPNAHITPSGYIKSRHLDDKACVAVMLGIIKELKEKNLKPKYTTHFFISNYEEVGHGSSSGLPEGVREFISLDMAAPGDGQASDEHKVTICAKDSSGPYDKKMKEKFVMIAKENNIPYSIDIYPYYNSDASSTLIAGWNIRTALIGPGVDASHSFERTHLDAIKATIDLTIKYILGE